MNTPNNLEWLTELLSNVASLEGEYPSNITIEEAKQTIATKLAEAYKQGYIDGGIATLTNDKEQE